jgi:hypothetical protein
MIPFTALSASPPSRAAPLKRSSTESRGATNPKPMMRRRSGSVLYRTVMGILSDSPDQTPSALPERAANTWRASKPHTLWLAVALPFERGVQSIAVKSDVAVSEVVALVLQRARLPGSLRSDECRLCVFTTPSDRRQMVLLEPTRAIGDYDVVCAQNRLSRPARAALLRDERVVNQWDARLVARCIGNTAAWFADTSASTAFVSKLADWMPSMRAARLLARSSSAPPIDDCARIVASTSSLHHENLSSQQQQQQQQLQQQQQQQQQQLQLLQPLQQDVPRDMFALRRAASFSLTNTSSASTSSSSLTSNADDELNGIHVLRRMRSDLGIVLAAALSGATAPAIAATHSGGGGFGNPSSTATISPRLALTCTGISMAVSCVDDWVRKDNLVIIVCSRYGATELAPPARSEPFAAAAELVVEFPLSIGVTVADLPLEAHLLVRLCTVDNAGAVDTVAWAVVPFYDVAGVLVSGSFNVRLWPTASAGRPLEMATSNANPFCDTATLQFRFDTPRWRRYIPPPILSSSDDVDGSGGGGGGGGGGGDMSQVVRDVLNDLTVRSPSRVLTASERAFVWQHRHAMANDESALALLAVAVPLDVAATRLAALADLHRAAIDCAPAADPVLCVRLLGADVVDSNVRAYAAAQLARVDDELLLLLMPQLMQALKCELHLDSALARLLVTRATRSTAIGHRFFFLAQCELASASVAPRVGVLLEAYLRSDWKARVALERLQELATSLTQIVAEMRVARRGDRSELVQSRLRALSRRVLGRPLVSPLNAQHQWGRLVVERCKVMQSKKMPLWLEFEACEPTRGTRTRHAVIFKCGDDLRQDMLALQVVRVLERAWQAAALGIEMTPYSCVATAIDAGFIEAVAPASTVASITAQYGGASAALRAAPLRKWFVTNARAQHVPLEEVVSRFASSCAGYSVATHVLGVADRHNDNVMVRPTGHVFHIDFGHILGNFKTKFGIKRETAPFVLTKDFVNVIGEGEPFDRFVELGAAAFVVARATAPLLFDLLRLMVPAQLPELRSVDAIQYMVQAMRLDLAPLGAIDHWRALTLNAQSTRRTALNNLLHIALGDRSERHDERTARAALAAIDEAHDGSTTSVVVRSGKEKRAALEQLLARAVAAVAERGVTLESVELVNIGKWSVECADLLHRLLRATVERLDLRRSVAMRDTLARVLADRMPHLLDLDLSGCALGNAALPALWHATPRLARLAIADCKLTDGAAPTLVELLARAMQLEQLDVSENRLGDEAVQLIGDSVQRLSTMRVLRSGVERVDSAVHERGAGGREEL